MSFVKHTFLEDLRTCNAANLEMVQATFAPPDRAARSAQPEPGEWCVDQCFQHLVLSFEIHMTHVLPVLERDKGTDGAATFTRSWLARTGYYRKQFGPQTKTKTRKEVTPSDHCYPDVFEQFAAQKERMAPILERAQKADLQQRCWFLGFAPINLGNYLELCVLHDVLLITRHSGRWRRIGRTPLSSNRRSELVHSGHGGFIQNRARRNASGCHYT